MVTAAEWWPPPSPAWPTLPAQTRIHSNSFLQCPGQDYRASRAQLHLGSLPAATFSSGDWQDYELHCQLPLPSPLFPPLVFPRQYFHSCLLFSPPSWDVMGCFTMAGFCLITASRSAQLWCSGDGGTAFSPASCSRCPTTMMWVCLPRAQDTSWCETPGPTTTAKIRAGNCTKIDCMGFREQN